MWKKFTVFKLHRFCRNYVHCKMTKQVTGQYNEETQHYESH